MMNQRRISTIFGASLAVMMLAGTVAYAQEGEVQGMVIGRNGPTMYVRTADGQRQNVMLQDNTQATEKGGFLGMSHKDLGVAALVPGLEVKVDGTFDQDHQLVAKKVEFSRGSLRTAKQIDAGMTPANEKLAAQSDQLASDRRDIEQGQQGLQAANQRLDEHGNLIAQNGQAIDQTNGRIGQLDQYDEKGTLTINFKNGSSVIAKKDQDALTDFIKTAADTPGYMIQVQGYASKVGNAATNQRLSSERADNVLTLIQQSGSVPLTRILAPAAMGTTDQTGDNHTRTGQAENRRVVVTVLVNKGITSGAPAQQSTGSMAAPANAPSDGTE